MYNDDELRESETVENAEPETVMPEPETEPVYPEPEAAYAEPMPEGGAGF